MKFSSSQINWYVLIKPFKKKKKKKKNILYLKKKYFVKEWHHYEAVDSRFKQSYCLSVCGK